jgi:hypothetical protein
MRKLLVSIAVISGIFVSPTIIQAQAQYTAPVIGETPYAPSQRSTQPLPLPHLVAYIGSVPQPLVDKYAFLFAMNCHNKVEWSPVPAAPPEAAVSEYLGKTSPQKIVIKNVVINNPPQIQSIRVSRALPVATFLEYTQAQPVAVPTRVSLPIEVRDATTTMPAVYTVTQLLTQPMVGLIALAIVVFCLIGAGVLTARKILKQTQLHHLTSGQGSAPAR